MYVGNDIGIINQWSMEKILQYYKYMYTQVPIKLQALQVPVVQAVGENLYKNTAVSHFDLVQL